MTQQRGAKSAKQAAAKWQRLKVNREVSDKRHSAGEIHTHTWLFSAQFPASMTRMGLLDHLPDPGL